MDIYHVLNRGVDKRNVVMDDHDRYRFVHSLFVFNDSHILNENHRKPGVTLAAKEREELVHIHAWCLMDNHYHLLLSPVNDDVINVSRFMKKLNMGYARYFNERHDRSGYLWQGKYKKLLVQNDAHFMYLPYYIHLNPLDYTFPEWRQGSVIDLIGAQKVLECYRWSSYLDYCERHNFPSLISQKLLSPVLGNEESQIKQIKQIITSPDQAGQSECIEN